MAVDFTATQFSPGQNLFPEPCRCLALRGAEEQIISWEIERDEVVRARRNFPLFRDRRPDAYGDIAAKPEALLD